jgi:hypothetical protein
MGTPNLAAFKATIATRGLSIASFSGGTLLLTHDQSMDQGTGDLTSFAIQAVSAQLDGKTPPLFPGFQKVEIA